MQLAACGVVYFTDISGGVRPVHGCPQVGGLVGPDLQVRGARRRLVLIPLKVSDLTVVVVEEIRADVCPLALDVDGL